MTTFKPFPELVVDDSRKLSPVIRHKSGDPFVMTDIPSIMRLVDCWNACRKLYIPTNHINETDEYVKRLEMLRKEAWARVEALESQLSKIATAAQGEAEAPSDDRVNPRRTGGDVANAGGSDVDRSAPRAPVEAGTEPTSLAGGLESGIDHSFVYETASGPDVKRASLSLGDLWSIDLSQAPRDGSPVRSVGSNA